MELQNAAVMVRYNECGNYISFLSDVVVAVAAGRDWLEEVGDGAPES